MKYLLVAGGELDIELLREVYSEMESPYVIGVDRGTIRLLEAGIRPDRAIGDFDSVDEEERSHITSDLVAEVLIPEKDDTDTEHAFDYALSHSPEEIILMGCTGRRIDHTLACIGILRRACDAGVRAYIQDRYNRIYVSRGTTIIRDTERYGKYISVVPYGDSARDLTEKGFKYELDHYDLSADVGRCISNELESQEGVISCEDYIIIMETRD